MKDIKTEINKKEEKEKVIRREKKSFLSKNNVILIATIFITIIIGIFIGGSSMYLYIINSDFLNLSEEEVEDNDPVLTTEEESTIIDVVDAVEESVVSIAVTEVSFSPSNGVVDETASIGSGFIADESGLIVTNQHVVSDEDSDYKVITSDGTEYDVVSITRDDVNDIAVLKIDAENLKPVELGDSDSLVVGQTVIAIGTPLGEYAGTVTTGVISGLNRSVTTSSSWYGDSSKDYENVIQTDAAVNSGNSGGPLLNTSGQVVGINFATTSNADNISFALPINIVKTRLDEYITYGKFIKPYLGISYQVIPEYIASYYSDVVAGVFIRSLDTDGPAYKAGLERGDIITEINDESVVDSFTTVLSQYKPEEEIKITYYRDGEYDTVKVTLGEAD